MTEKLKAYALTYDSYETLSIIVWAETAGKAKSLGTNREELGNPEFTEISCRRCKWADDLEGIDEEKLWTETLRHGWSYHVDIYDANSMITEDDLPQIKEAGGLYKFCNLWLDGKVTTAYQKEMEEWDK
ncbi:hypothetical protein FEZ51_02010 [Pediococcus stilesii]|uniref:Uncharacterized protein n=1 Tax=Pediococcus stilesii TaxID=331679 RepID=A0A5R9BXJ6_9LACO|nr:hypothetical protein [Pediococcus stilesii]TLQ05458.1 hypothetical protein FEZ51_02010 [Pediococcus stilesii]